MLKLLSASLLAFLALTAAASGQCTPGPCAPCDLNVDGLLTSADEEVFLCYLSGACGGGAGCSDFDCDGFYGNDHDVFLFYDCMAGTWECFGCPPTTGTPTTANYTVTGAPTGVGWSWRIESTGATFAMLEDRNVPGIPTSGTTLQVAQAFANSINDFAANKYGCATTQVVAAAGLNGTAVELSLLVNDPFKLYVGAADTNDMCLTGADPTCLVGTTLPACTFNPSILQKPNSGQDCNDNRWDDAIDISWGRSQDANSNGIPDECENSCGSPDFDGDGDNGTDLDIEAFFDCVGGDCCPQCASPDFDGDGDAGTDLDIEAFFRVIGGGTC